MIGRKKVLAIIPARGGSKGVKRKNLVKVGEHSLLGWALIQAQESSYIDHTIVTSDDDEILREAESYGCNSPLKRPKHLAEDSSSSLDVVLHAISQIDEEFDYIVLLQPTSPLRIPDDINQCLALCESENVGSCISVVEIDRSPYWIYSLSDDNRLEPFFDVAKRPSRRQESPAFYSPNGAVYVFTPTWIKDSKSFITTDTVAYIMPAARSIDIDSQTDLELANSLIASKSEAISIE